MQQEIFLRVNGLKKSYKDTIAVENISFTVNQGEVFGLLGPNGAGKTTTIKMLCGLLKADSGTITYGGLSLSDNYNRIKSMIGLCPQEIVIWELLTCMEQLKFAGISYGLPAKKAAGRADHLLHTLGLADKSNKLAKTLDAFVPGLISLSVLMVLFTATASIVKENDQGTIVRLKLSKLGTINVLGGVSIVQAVVTVIAIIITYWTALALGYRPAGSFPAVLAVGIISSFSMVAMSLLLAGFLDTVFDVLTIGCFPFFIFMFFSGSMFPLPKLTLFTLAGKTFGITDILSLTHTVNAFNKIMNYDAGLADISFELLMITVLTAAYFIAGVLIYRKRKLSRA